MGNSVSNSEAWSTGHAVSNGEAYSTGHAVSNGEAWSTGHAVSNGEAYSTADAHSTSYQHSRSAADASAAGMAMSESGAQGFAGGFGGSIIPGFSITRSWQTEDDVAIRLTEISRMLESLLNQASTEGGFMTTALLLANDRGAKAAEALIPQSFHGPNVPTPVITVPGEDSLRLNALAARPSLTPDGDPFHAGLWTKWGTLLTPGMLAAYTAPNLFEEGTVITVQRKLPALAFYPETDGEVTLGHQISPETELLTNAPLKLSRERSAQQHFHTAFAANTGYGKSVAAERMAYETTLYWHMKSIVLDFGAGWRKMLNAPGLEGHVEIRQLSPGGVRPLRWNPLQIGRNISPEMHWRSFSDIFGNLAQLGQKRQIHDLQEALRQVYVAAGVLVKDPDVKNSRAWGSVKDAQEANVTGAAVGTSLAALSRDALQRLAVYRSKFVGLQDLYDYVDEEMANTPPKNIAYSILEGIRSRLEPFVQGEAAGMYAAGEDTVDINEIVPGDWGLVVLEGGTFLDTFSKSFLLSWASWQIYTDAVITRIRRAHSEPARLQLFFEEAAKMFTGLDREADNGAPTTADQLETMWEDSRKYGIWLHVITQQPSMLPAGISGSCNNMFIGQLKNIKDRDAAMAMLHRSEKGFVDENWRNFISSIPAGRMIVKLGYSLFDRSKSEPMYIQPLLLDVAEPTDEEIARQLGEIRV